MCSFQIEHMNGMNVDLNRILSECESDDTLQIVRGRIIMLHGKIYIARRYDAVTLYTKHCQMMH